MKRKNMFDLLENSDEGELGMIDRLTPELSDEQFERILEMSKRKRNIMRAAEERNIDISSYAETEDEVEGVEDYKRPVWRKFMATAASLILLSGGIALCHNLLKRSGDNSPVVVPDIAVQVTTANTDSKKCENDSAATVTADVNAEAADEALTEVSETTSTTVSANSVTVDAVQTEGQVTESTEEIYENPEYRAEAEAWVKNWLDANYLGFVNFDNLDLSDTFDIQCNVIYLDNGASEEDRPREMHTLTYVHYVDPKYNTVEDIKRDQIDYVYPDYEEGRNGMTEGYIRRFCGIQVVPGEQIEDNAYNKYDTYPVFTEYDGKIYMYVYRDGQLENKPLFKEARASGAGKWYVRNCQADSFELIKLIPDASYDDNLFKVEKVNGKWRIVDNSPLTMLFSDEEIAEIYKEYEKYRCE